MEHSISYIFTVTVPVISFILYLLSKGLLLISILGGTFFIFLSRYIYNNLDRKETLNIIRTNRALYFNLSDDELFSVKLSNEQSLSEAIKKAISDEMATIKDIVGQIDFINFRDDKLHRELNLLIR